MYPWVYIPNGLPRDVSKCQTYQLSSFNNSSGFLFLLSAFNRSTWGYKFITRSNCSGVPWVKKLAVFPVAIFLRTWIFLFTKIKKKNVSGQIKINLKTLKRLSCSKIKSPARSGYIKMCLFFSKEIPCFSQYTQHKNIDWTRLPSRHFVMVRETKWSLFLK